MKTFNRFITEKLKITKNTKILDHLFSEKYIIFLPWNKNLSYMEGQSIYKKYRMSIQHNTIYLIDKDKAIDIYNKLPLKKINIKFGNFKDLSLFIFKIPKDIHSKEELQSIDNQFDYHPWHIGSHDCWELIKSIDELK